MARCALVSVGRGGPCNSMALAAWQAVCGALPQTRRQGYSRVSCLPPPWMRGQLASLSHVTLTCPVSQAVWQCFASTWTAISQQEPLPLHADLLLADDRRYPWQPAARLASLWQRLRLMVITQLWAAYCTSRSRPYQATPSHIAARDLAAARDRMRRDWLLVGSDIRLRAGVLSHWLRGRQPAMTREQFQQRLARTRSTLLSTLRGLRCLLGRIA